MPQPFTGTDSQIGAQMPSADPSSILQALSVGQTPQSPAYGPGAILAGFGAGFQNQPNPVVGQMQQQQALDMRQQLGLFSVMQAVQRQRQEQQKTQIELLGHLSKSDVPEAKDYGLKGLFKIAETQGAPPLPDALKQGMLRGAIKPAEMEEVGKLLVRQMSPDLIQRMYPWATPEVTQGMTGGSIENLAASLKLRTSDQLRKDAIAADLASTKLMREQDYPELTPVVQPFVQKAHKDVNGGQTYYEGTPASQKQAREAGFADWQAFEAAKRPSHAGERIVTPQNGQYWNKTTRQYEPAVSAADLQANPENYSLVSRDEIKMQHYASRAIPTLVEIKRLIPRILATQPVENIKKALELEGAKFISSSEDLRRLNTLVFDASFEQARGLGGGSTVRVQLLNLLQKHAGISTMDTQKTAMGVIDISMVNMENLRRAPVRDPMLGLHQRIGPGKYIVQDKAGNKKGMVLTEGQISPPDLTVLENY